MGRVQSVIPLSEDLIKDLFSYNQFMKQEWGRSIDRKEDHLKFLAG